MDITLRAPEPDDIDLMYAWANDVQEWPNTLSDGLVSRHNLTEYVLCFNDNLAIDGQLRLIICANGSPAGTVDLCDANTRNATAWLAIYIDKAYRRQGIGLAAIDRILYIAAQRYALRSVAAMVAADNTASTNLFLRAGFDNIGTLSQWVVRGTHRCDVAIFQKTLC